MTFPSAPPRPETEKGLPKGLWIGTAVFAVVSAAALFAVLRLGQQTYEGESSAQKPMERPAFQKPPAAQAPAEPQAEASMQMGGGAPDKKEAGRHWTMGVVAFQKGDYAKARDEWLLCRRYDPANSDCAAGLQRIDNAYGGGK
ncbi:MAG: hypothetical protein HY922_11585 [Elusimicrobia bacterium]|nr:hypothetical protein [Elusimicrobiota bacterium]